MASYGLRYQGTFDPLKDNAVSPVYTMKILQKDYTGLAQSFTFAGKPVKHTWETDDPKAPIKGSSLTLNLINRGSLPIKSFYSSEDDTFKVELYYLTELLFTGYLVQDDHSEIMLDMTHEISLAANDNLGLLKEVDFDKAPLNFARVITWNFTSEGISSTAPHTITLGPVYGPSFLADVQVGDRLIITGSAVDGTYTVSAISGLNITVVENIGTMGFDTNVTIEIHRSSLYEKRSLLDVIKTCLSLTGLDLQTYIYSNLLETTQNSASPFLAQTMISLQTFMKNESEWYDCYEILQRIMDRFNLSLFQAKGRWNIVRWAELVYYNNALPGFIYDKDFNLIGTTVLDEEFTAGIGEVIKAETGLLERCNGPLKFNKETFNYRQPPQLLRNFDLKQLGTLLRDYSSGTGTTYRRTREYTVPWWYESEFNAAGVTTPTTWFIRIVTDILDNELERYLVVRGDATKTFPIEVNQGDVFIFSYQFRTSLVQTGPFTSYSIVYLTDGTQNKTYGGLINKWKNTTPTLYTAAYILPGDTDQWQSVEVDITDNPLPFDGILNFHLPDLIHFSTAETHYKDIRFQYYTFINETTKIIGQTHTNTQAASVKKKDEEEIYLDTTTKNSIAGALFLNTRTGLLQTRTSRWKRGHLTESKRLGEITTQETMNYRQTPRTLLEGSFKGLVSGSKHVSLLSVMRYNYFPSLSFIAGKLEIDYKDEMFNTVMWEDHADGEAEVASEYVFDYKYDPL